MSVTHPSHRLYDAACELLAAAQDLRESARRPGTAEAIPATLGCITVAVAELASCTGALAEELRRTRPLGDREAAAAMRAIDHVTEELLAAKVACDLARAGAARTD